MSPIQYKHESRTFVRRRFGKAWADSFNKDSLRAPDALIVFEKRCEAQIEYIDLLHDEIDRLIQENPPIQQPIKERSKLVFGITNLDWKDSWFICENEIVTEDDVIKIEDKQREIIVSKFNLLYVRGRYLNLQGVLDEVKNMNEQITSFTETLSRLYETKDIIFTTLLKPQNILK